MITLKLAPPYSVLLVMDPVHLCTATIESIAKLPVPATTARVRIWANHKTEPDFIHIVVTSAEAAPL
jgi:hypothetical protein